MEEELTLFSVMEADTKLVGMPTITSIDDMPSLITALETFGRFESAGIYKSLYFKLKRHIELEHNDRATTTK